MSFQFLNESHVYISYRLPRKALLLLNIFGADVKIHIFNNAALVYQR